MHKLHLRIWMAILATLVAVLLGAWLVWHLSREAAQLRQGGSAAATPPREIVLRTEGGDLVAQYRVAAGQGLPRNAAGQVEVTLQAAQDVKKGEALRLQLPQRRGPPEFSQLPPEARAAALARIDAQRQAGDPERYAGDPEREAHRQLRQTREAREAREARLLPAWLRPPYGFVVLLGLLALAAGLAVYPIARSLTRRLGSLHHTVKAWGQGDLTARNAADLTRGKDEVAEVAREFNAAAEQVQKLLGTQETLLASQKSLLANASHELRSPLARLRMALELANLPPEAQEEAKQNIAELDALIEEILLSSRLDAAQSSIKALGSGSNLGSGSSLCAEVSNTASPLQANGFEFLEIERLQALCSAEAAAFGAQFRQHGDGASLQTQSPHNKYALYADPALLKRLLRNLLQNASRYGAPTVLLTLELQHAVADRVSDSAAAVAAAAATAVKGDAKAELAAEAELESGSSLGCLLRVTDCGAGVAQSERGRIFEPFYRGLNTRAARSSEAQGGVGLGLALVRQIAQHHGGSVACTNRPDGQSGACFEVRLPAYAAAYDRL